MYRIQSTPIAHRNHLSSEVKDAGSGRAHIPLGPEESDLHPKDHEKVREGRVIRSDAYAPSEPCTPLLRPCNANG